MMKWLDTVPVQTDVQVNVPSMAHLLADLEDRLRHEASFSVATLNLDHVVKIRRSTDFLNAYRHHTHVTADGNPIVWLSRMAGHDIDLVAGSDLVCPLTECAAKLNVPVALFGTTTASLEGAAAALKDRYPELDIVAQISPALGFDPLSEEAGAHIETLRQSGARLCFLALGAPKQEIFAASAQQVLPQIGFVSIGAGLDFLSGAQTRAPRIVKILGAEWLWRLLSNPRRFGGRYWACLAILPGLTRTALRIRRRADLDI